MRASKTERERTMEDADREKEAKEESKRAPGSFFLSLSLSDMEFSEGTRCSWNSRHRGSPQPRLHGSANFLPALITSRVRRFIRLVYIQPRYTSFCSSCIFPLFLRVPLPCYFPRNSLHLSCVELISVFEIFKSKLRYASVTKTMEISKIV